MKLIVGLGNPGKKYLNSRHNLGFKVVEEMADDKWLQDKKLKAEICEMKIGKGRMILAKPQTFMNNSGQAVEKLVISYQIPVESLYVVHDDLDIALGEYKIQLGKGPKIHKGLVSIENHLKTKNFWRLRIGIASENYQRIKAQRGSMAETFVLKPFLKKERQVMERVIEKVSEKLLNLCREENAD